MAAYVSMLAILVAIGHVVWLVERRRNEQFPTSYLRGVWEGVWWAAVTVTTVGYGDRTVRGIAGRMVAMVWMFFGIFLIANFTAIVTTELAVERSATLVRGLEDLHDRRVATVYGTTAAEYLSAMGVRYKSVTTVVDAIDLLQRGETDAVVYDAPVLRHHMAQRRDPSLRLVGGLLTREHYAIALPPDSPYEEAINAALLSIYEDGTHAELSEQWGLAGDT
jgi:ABC-type amino acid transport substrate-binding protein